MDMRRQTSPSSGQRNSTLAEEQAAAFERDRQRADRQQQRRWDVPLLRN